MKYLPWVAAAMLMACSPSTSRPPFTPVPEAKQGELELDVSDATERLAAELTEAGIPVAIASGRDGYLETPWFDTATGLPTSNRVLGSGVVRVRAWVSPAAPRHSEITVETVHRPFADPSRAPRELERSVGFDHPTRVIVRAVFDSVGARTPISEADAVVVQMPPPVPAAMDNSVDSAAALPLDTLPADTVRADSVPPPVDSVLPAPEAPARTPVPARTPAPARTPPPAPARDGASIQVAATTDTAVANVAAGRLREMGLEARIVREQGMLKVRTERYPRTTSVQPILRRLRTVFPDAFVVRTEN